MDSPDVLQVEGSINSSNVKKVSKRRSSVFKRQSIVPEHQDLESTNTTEETNHQSKKFKLQNESALKKFDLRNYIDSVKKEDIKWRELNSKRKAAVQELAKSEKSLQQTGQPLDLTCLTDSERAFLAAKPDYEEFNKNLFQLHTTAVKVSFLKQSTDHFKQTSLATLEKDKADAEKRVIQLSDLYM